MTNIKLKNTFGRTAAALPIIAGLSIMPAFSDAHAQDAYYNNGAQYYAQNQAGHQDPQPQPQQPQPQQPQYEQYNVPVEEPVDPPKVDWDKMWGGTGNISNNSGTLFTLNGDLSY